MHMHLAGHALQCASISLLQLHVDMGATSSPSVPTPPVGVLCPTACEDCAPENMMWCVSIASLDKNVETCITVDPATQEVFTNNSCEAEVVGLSNYLYLDSVSSSHTLFLLFIPAFY